MILSQEGTLTALAGGMDGPKDFRHTPGLFVVVFTMTKETPLV